MANKYDYHNSVEVGNIANEHITQYLKKEGYAVIDVEADKQFQKHDVDLIIAKMREDKLNVTLVEIKGDTYGKSKNYFLETISNKSKKSKGCFLYSKADYFFYYFVDSKELNMIPLEEARRWVRKNRDKFEAKDVQTKVNGGFYESQGLLVPKKELNKAVNVITRHLDYYVEEKQTKLGV